MKKSVLAVIAAALLFTLSATRPSLGWTAPVGIPAPEFGITETHQMFAGESFDFGAGLKPYPDAGNGPYTHYIDMTSPGATDADNPFGSPARPRVTIPADLPAGSVVEVHGGPYDFRNLEDKLAIFGNGSAARPIFVRGVSAAQRPVFAKDILVFGAYIIIENLTLSPAKLVIRQYRSENVHHIALRHLEMQGEGTVAAANAGIAVGGWNDHQTHTIEDVVVWDNRIHAYGDWQAAEENDLTGVCVSGYEVHRFWMLDNDIYHMGGDGVRVGNNDGWTPAYTSSHMYIGRNKMHHNRENAVDIKAISDVVVSQNQMYYFRPTNSDEGAAAGVHYDPANVWFILNEFSDATDAIICSGVEKLYIVGNLIRDCADGIKFWGAGEIHMVNNTIVGCGNGITNVSGSGAAHPIINNIIAKLRDSTDGLHINLDESALAASSPMSNNLVYQNGGRIRIRWGGREYRSIADFIAGSGKGSGCSQADPLFVNAAGNDYHLSNQAGALSPAIDAGAALSYDSLFAASFTTSLAFDLERRGRIRDGDGDGAARIDLGCFEHPGSSLPTLNPPRNLRIKQ